MNIKLVAAALALPVLLAACAPEVESTVYLADVMKAVESGEAISVPAVLRVPQSGEDGASGLVCRPHRDGGVVVRQRRGDSVLIAFAADERRDGDTVPASDTCTTLGEWLTAASTAVGQRPDPGR